MTGRGLGYCAGYDTPGFTKGVPRGGRGGYGRGFGRGRRWRYYPPGPPPEPYYRPRYQPEPYYPPERAEPTEEQRESEKAYLKDAVQRIEEELAGLRERIEELSEE